VRSAIEMDKYNTIQYNTVCLAKQIIRLRPLNEQFADNTKKVTMLRHRFAALLLMSSLTCIWKPMAAAKVFEKTHYPNGTVTCALDKPSLVIPLDQLSNGDTCVAPGALCALQCLQDPDCTNYNYRNDPTCEIYHYTPTNCSSVTGCYHAEVSWEMS